MKGPFRLRIRIGFGLAWAVLGLISVVSFWSTASFAENSRWVAHTLAVLQKVEELRSNVAGIESASRGFVITGNESLFDSFQARLALPLQSASQLRELTANSPSHQVRLDQLIPLINEKVAFMASSLELRKQEGFEAGVKAIETSKGRMLMDEITHQIEAMKAEERGLLDQRERASQISRQATTWVIGLGSLLAFALVTWTLVLLQRDIASRLGAQQALRESEGRLTLALEAGRIGTWSWNLPDDAVALDQRSHAIFGLTPTEGVRGEGSGASSQKAGVSNSTPDPWPVAPCPTSNLRPLSSELFLSMVHPEDVAAVKEAIKRALTQKTAFEIDYRVVWPDQNIHVLSSRAAGIQDERGQPLRLTGVVQDITERKRVEAALAQHVRELARSNAELEQFAYVASHDLQEPLRMVASYTQLLARRYRGRLDADADEFIDFAVDGASRMQNLIEDLLSFSRVGTRGRPFEQVSGELVLDQALSQLRVTIEENGAEVTHGPLPSVVGDASQLTQLLQNLIGNAIKFRGREPPRVHVSARPEGQDWVFSVQDNGIGIDPQFRERIFVIFQRLHSRSRYPGTGIGLAICKKIAERHGGRIWVESKPGQGATFLFTLPQKQSDLCSESGEWIFPRQTRTKEPVGAV
jgi:signal transduction histidine kinase/CHASE3 domain sensor protein